MGTALNLNILIQPWQIISGFVFMNIHLMRDFSLMYAR